MEILGQAAAASSKEELLATLSDTVSSILREDIPADLEPEKTWQLRQAQKADFYWRAIQNLAPQLTDTGVAFFSQLGTPFSSTYDRSTNVGLYDYVLNIYRGYGRKFIAVLGQRMPNVKAVPNDPNDETSITATRMADAAAAILRAQWGAEVRNLELSLQLWKNGTTFAYTPWVADKRKYGSRTEPKIELRTVQVGLATYQCVNCGTKVPDTTPVPAPCPNCGRSIGPEDYQPPQTQDVPQQVGVTEYANGAVELHLCNIMTVNAPFFAHDLEDTPWIRYEYDEYRGRLIAMYPSLRENTPSDSFGVDSASSTLGTQVRDMATSPMGVPNPHRSNRWTYARTWLKPEMYESVKDKQKREALQENFPDGLKATTVSGKVVDLENEKLTEVWAMCKPETSEYIFADAIGADMLPIQDLKNDTLQIAYQTIETGIPPIFVHPQMVDNELWAQMQATPGRIIPVLPGASMTLDQGFYQPEPSRFSDQMLPWMNSTENDARVGVGTTEPIFGGAVDSTTAHEAELKKNAALQQLGTTYVYMRKFWEQVYTNGARQLSKYGAGTIRNTYRTPNGIQSMLLDVSKLTPDTWHYESEEAFPMTHAEQRSYLMWLLGNPEAAQALGVTHPRNSARNQQLLGFTGYYNEGADEHEKALDIIAELVQAAPIQQPKPDGSGVDLVPSIPIEDFDDHAFMAKEAFGWCNGPDGRRTKKDNEQGYMNVVAWGMAHQKAGAPPPAPPPQPKLTLSGKVTEMPPDQANQIIQAFGLPGGATPPGPQLPGAPPTGTAGVMPPAPAQPPMPPNAKMPPPPAPAGNVMVQ